MSVVVPLWLMAMTSVSDMSSRELEAAELGGDNGVGTYAVVGQRGEHRGQALPHDRRGALPDHDDPPDAAFAQARPQRIGQRLCAQCHGEHDRRVR